MCGAALGTLQLLLAACHLCMQSGMAQHGSVNTNSCETSSALCWR